MSNLISNGSGCDFSEAFRESVFVFVGLAALTAVEIALTRNAAVVSHPMWLDECVSSLLLTDPSFSHMASAIYGGVDTNGPAFYIAVWPVVHLLGATDVVALRFITAAVMLIALSGMYVTCRRFVEPGRAAIAASAIAVHPAVLVQTWQVRMYGFWLAAAAWFCAYTVFAAGRGSWRMRLAGCLLAILLVTSHWLGVFALVLVSVPALVVTRSESDRRWNHALPLVAGLAVLGLSIPVIMSQRHILSVATWIDPASLSSVLTQLRGMFIVPSMAIVAVYVALRLVTNGNSNIQLLKPPKVVLPALALLLYPATLIGMSFTMQSVLLERYMLPTVIALAVVIAASALPLAHLSGALTGALAAAALVVVGCLELNGLRAVNRQADARAARVIAISDRALAARQHVVFARRFEAYPLIQMRPQLADSVALLDFSEQGPS